MARNNKFNMVGELLATDITKFARFGGGGGYSGPSAEELERQEEANHKRRMEEIELQRQIAREEREFQKQLAEEAQAAEEKALARERKATDKRELASRLAASEEAAEARDVEYDPNSGSVLSQRRNDIQIPDQDESQ